MYVRRGDGDGRGLGSPCWATASTTEHRGTGGSADGKRRLHSILAVEGGGSRTFARKRDAQEWERKQVETLKTGAWADPKAGERPVREWCEIWMAAQPARAPATERKIRGVIGKQIAGTSRRADRAGRREVVRGHSIQSAGRSGRRRPGRPAGARVDPFSTIRREGYASARATPGLQTRALAATRAQSGVRQYVSNRIVLSLRDPQPISGLDVDNAGNVRAAIRLVGRQPRCRVAGFLLALLT